MAGATSPVSAFKDWRRRLSLREGSGFEDARGRAEDSGAKAFASSKRRLLKVLSWPLKVTKGLKTPDGDAESSDDEEIDVLASLADANGPNETPLGEPLALESLFEICSTNILNSVTLTSRLEAETPFTISDLFMMLGPARERVKSKLESSTLSLRGNRQPMAQLCATIKAGAQQYACLGTLNLDRVAAMGDGVLSKFLVNQNGKPRLPSVRVISMAENPGVTDFGVKRLLAAYGSRLTGITISNTSATHKSVKLMAKTCPNLQIVGLSYMVHMRDKHLQRLVAGCRKITDLDISYCAMLTDEAMSCLPGLYFLQTLNLSYNTSIGQGVEMLARCPFLRSLRLQDCRQVRNSAMTQVVIACTMLDTLCVRGCLLLSQSLVHSIADNCCCLRALDVAACPQINGNRALGILARSEMTRRSIKEFASTQRVVMHASPQILDLYAIDLDALY